jgi:hypothetical protein
VLSSHFWALFVTGLIGQSAGPIQMLGTGLTSAEQTGLTGQS